jgi:hypothetical protein
MCSGGFPKLINVCLSLYFRNGQIEPAWDELHATEAEVDPCVRQALESGLSSIKCDSQDLAAAKTDVAMVHIFRPAFKSETPDLDYYDRALIKAMSEECEDFTLSHAFTSEHALNFYMAHVQSVMARTEQEQEPPKLVASVVGCRAGFVPPIPCEACCEACEANVDQLSERGKKDVAWRDSVHRSHCSKLKSMLKDFAELPSVCKRLELTHGIIMELDVWVRLVLGTVPTCTDAYSQLVACRLFDYFHGKCYLPRRFSAAADSDGVLREFFGGDLDNDGACVRALRKLTHKLDGTLEEFVRRAMGFCGGYATEIVGYVAW